MDVGFSRAAATHRLRGVELLRSADHSSPRGVLVGAVGLAGWASACCAAPGLGLNFPFPLFSLCFVLGSFSLGFMITFFDRQPQLPKPHRG